MRYIFGSWHLTNDFCDARYLVHDTNEQLKLDKFYNTPCIQFYAISLLH